MRSRTLCAGLLVCCSLIFSGCQEQQTASTGQTQTVNTTQSDKQEGKMQITSPAFNSGQAIPALFTCDGKDISPALEWTGIPPETKSLALVCDDPDAPMGTWIHWIVINIPPQTTGIPENGPLPQNARGIKNSWGKVTYGGPCPPSGTHRYFFRLYALDVAELEDVNPGNYQELLSQHTLVQAELMGTYRRR